MFGHSNNDSQASGDQATDPTADDVLNSVRPETIAPSAPSTSSSNSTDDATTIGDDMVSDYVMTDLPHIAEPSKPAPTLDPSPAPVIVDDSANATSTMPNATVPSIATTPVSISSAAGADTTDDLLEIKQAALQELSPLVGHLQQTPEEQFRTTMMMIQASDDQTMLRAAFDAAKQIEDEKARAQALLDVVNEINYFTQQQPDQAEAA